MKKKNKVILQFICYSPRIFSGLDRFNVKLAEKLVDKGFLPIFIFLGTLDNVPRIENELKKVGAKTEVLHRSNYFKLVIQVFRLFYKYKPVIVHSHFINFYKILTAIFSVIFRAKYYVSFHSLFSPLEPLDYVKEKGIIKRVFIWLYFNALIYLSAKIFTVSDGIRNQFLRYASSNSEKVKTLYLGVESGGAKKSKDVLRNNLDLPQASILLCNISAIEHLKGIDILCRAISILKSKYHLSNFLFCHIGGVRTENKENLEYRDFIYALTKDLDIESEMKWLGPRNDVTEILSAFDLYVHPSRMEGLGVANMEAAVHSLPIVGTNVGGIPEIVIDGVNGFLFETENQEELADHIFKLTSNASLRKKMGDMSFDIVSKKFNIDIESERLINIYGK